MQWSLGQFEHGQLVYSQKRHTKERERWFRDCYHIRNGGYNNKWHDNSQIITPDYNRITTDSL